MNEVPGSAGYDPGKFSEGLPDEQFDDLYVAKAIAVVKQKELEEVLGRKEK